MKLMRRVSGMTLWSSIAVLLGSVLLTSCGGNDSLSGAGATFPEFFYKDIASQFGEEYGIRVNYGATGSGAGIRNLQDLTVDFGGSDVFLSDEEMAAMPEVLHIPTCIGGVVMGYNLPEVSNLNMTPELVRLIYTGEVTSWDDARIAAVNPDVTLPAKAITPVYRSEGSGTTAVFTGFMSETDSVWAEKIGAGKSVDFMTGIAAKGNPGVAGVISQTEGAIGYLGSEYALAQEIPFSTMLNSSGKFVEANMESISISANVADMPADTRMIIYNPQDSLAYPISTFTWMIVYKEQAYNNRSVEQAKALQDFLLYVVGEKGASSAKRNYFSPLPAIATDRAEAVINSMTYNGELLKDITVANVKE